MRRGYVYGTLYGHVALQIGRRLSADTFPEVTITDEAQVSIGDDVTLRRNVEIRAHGRAKIIIEDGVRIDRGVRILAANDAVVHLKEGCRLGLYSVLNGGDSITVGRKCLISGFVYLQTSQHRFDQQGVAMRDQGYVHEPVVLEDDVWLGTHVVIMPGVTMGSGSIAGSNAVVTKSVPAGDVVGGVPAKTLTSRHEP